MSTLGLDLSSQSLSGLIINETTGDVVAEASINFAASFPEYKTKNGFVTEEGGVVVSYPTLFLDALDTLLENLQPHLSQVQAVSLSGQQHASVYCSEEMEEKLSQLNPAFSLKSQLESGLSRKVTPIWMDHSTTQQCRDMTDIMGEQAVIKISGSPYCERFTAAQIRKFAEQEPENYAATSKIHLVSSFIASVFCGKHVALDHGDGSGMNLMDLNTGDWNDALLEACAPDLKAKLPALAPSRSIAGVIDSYFVKKYGLPSLCQIVLSSGDNPNSLIGCGAIEPGTAVISLGTSDTFFSASGESPIDTQGVGHVFGHPAGGFMSLICLRNGSLTREQVREVYDVSWEDAERMILDTAPTEPEDTPLPYLMEEMVPPMPVTTKAEDFRETFPKIGLTSLIESQFLSLEIESRKHLSHVTTIRVTGGASNNQGIVQIIADVFQAKVECIQVSNSAALGAAMRAAEATTDLDWPTLCSRFSGVKSSTAPRQEHAEIYKRKSDILSHNIKSFQAK